MLILSLILVSAAFVIHSTVGVYCVVKTYREYKDISRRFGEFFSQPSPDQPSDFNKILDQISIMFADRYRIALMAADRGAAGAASRDLTRGLEEIAAEEIPAAALAQGLPKSLKKNPLALAGLNMIINRVANQSTGKTPRNGSSSQPRFNL